MKYRLPAAATTCARAAQGEGGHSSGRRGAGQCEAQGCHQRGLVGTGSKYCVLLHCSAGVQQTGATAAARQPLPTPTCSCSLSRQNTCPGMPPRCSDTSAPPAARAAPLPPAPCPRLFSTSSVTDWQWSCCACWGASGRWTVTSATCTSSTGATPGGGSTQPPPPPTRVPAAAALRLPACCWSCRCCCWPG